MNVDEFLALVELPHKSNRFVLGPFDPGITLFRQQTRALNLIYALKESGRLKSRQRIAIIGGGVAGVTAAAAAATLGFATTLIERTHSLNHLQQGCDTRWLHPHIYDWPGPGAFRVYAGLPLLDWHASSAANVAKQIVRQFEEIKTERNISVYLGSTILSIDGTRISWKSSKPRNRFYRKFDAIIFAVGFGIESNLNARWPSYWRNDSIHQPEAGRAPDKKTSYLISGTGDGGLIDLMRVTIGDFNHETIHRELFDGSEKDLFERLVRIKEEWKGGHPSSDDDWLHDQYDELERRELLGIASERIKGRLRPDTEVCLNGARAEFAQALRLDKASMFSTLVAYCLRQLDAFDYRPGELAVKDHKVLIGTQEVQYDQIVIRHGARIADAYASAQCDDVNKILKSADLIRQYLNTASRLWPPGWWDNESRVEHVSQATVALATTFVSTLRDMVGLVGEASPDAGRGGAEFRITMHRLCKIQGEIHYQQIARYAGTQAELEGKVGRVFSVNTGLGGLCCRVGRPVRLTKGAGFEELQRELKLQDTPARPIGKATESFLAVPFFTSCNDSKGRAKVILLLYVSSTRANFFSDTILKTVYTACRGFVSNVEQMLKQDEIRVSCADFDGYATQDSDTDNTLFDLHREILTTDDNIFDQYVNYLTFKSVQFFEVSQSG